MEQRIIQELPSGFHEYLTSVLADGIARRIVEDSIINIHSEKTDGQEGNSALKTA